MMEEVMPVNLYFIISMSETGRISSIAEEILGFKNHIPVEINRISDKKNIF